ncbi:MAG: DUF1549 and DUF1553 domain-containing protein [bacterium]|jgi:hypothetical protein
MNRTIFLLSMFIYSFSCVLNLCAAEEEFRLLPEKVVLTRQGDMQRLLLEQFRDQQAVADLTGKAQFSSSNEHVAVVAPDGTIHARGDGEAVVVAEYGRRRVEAHVTVSGCDSAYTYSFTNDIQPVLTKMGCNTGACHGAAAGKNGFRLSLRGYDHPTDYNVLTRQANGRRVLLAEPEQSLILLKPTMQVPHAGGLRFQQDSLEYEILRNWIRQGATPPNEGEKSIERIEVFPKLLRLQQGDEQQLLVRAHYEDGSFADVTRWVKYDTTDDGVAVVDENGRATVKGSGSAALTVWYASKVSFARVNVPYPEDIPQNIFAEAERNNFIDDAILEQLQALNIAPSKPADDLTFVRRAYLDAVGVLPTSEEITRFLLDPAKEKRIRLIDRLLQREEFVDYWTYKWSDLLLVNSRNLRNEALWAYYRFIRERVEENQGWDRFVKEILTAKGSTLENGAGNFFLLHKETTDLTETTSQAFLGMSIMCARCHNHPMEKWTQDDYYGMANLFGRVKIKDGDQGGEALVLASQSGEVLHPLRNMPMQPKPLDGEPLPYNGVERREHLANWLTAPDNPYFARAIINRVWKNFMGVGLVEPEDDLRLTNPPANETLFAALERDFIEHGYDIRHLIRMIMSSAAYQRSSESFMGNEKDTRQFSHYYIKRLPAEVILDAYSQVTGVPTKFEGYPEGWRALQLPDTNVASYFLKTFGRPPRLLTCSCERQSTPTLTQSLHISNGDTLNDKLRAQGNRLDNYLEQEHKLEDIIFDIYLTALSRAPKEDEIATLMDLISGEDGWQKLERQKKRELLEDVCWAILSSKEFLFNS